MNRPVVRNSRIKLSVGQIFWREVGEGSTVVFLHGTWNDSSEWLSVMEYLSANCHCFTPDLLGFGESEHPKIHYSIHLEVECLAEYLDALKLHQVYLVGHCLGAWIAASYALRHSEQVQGLVLLSPQGVLVQGVSNPWQKLGLSVNCPGLIFKLLRLFSPLTKLLGLQTKIEQLWQQRQQLMRSPAASQLLFKRRPAEIKAELLQEKLPWLKVPVLVLQGEQDSATAKAFSQAYAGLLPNAELKIISEGGSNLPESVPDVVASYIQEFVNDK